MKGQKSLSRSSIILFAGIALIILSVFVITVISAGYLDPKPLGPLLKHELPQQAIPVINNIHFRLLSSPLPDQSSVQLHAQWLSGSQDMVYGLNLGDGTEGVFTAVSPLGYATIFTTSLRPGESLQDNYVMELQPWPHIERGDAVNEIWLDIVDSKLVSVRINRELLWTGEIEFAVDNVYFWAEAFDEPGAVKVVDYELFGSR